MQEISLKRKIGGIFLGLISGLPLPALLLSVFGAYPIDPAPFCIAILYAFSGWWGAGAAIVSTTGYACLMLSQVGLIAYLPVYLLLSVVPGLALVQLVAKPSAFHRDIALAIGACSACVLASLGWVYLRVGADLIGALAARLPDMLYRLFGTAVMDQFGMMLGAQLGVESVAHLGSYILFDAARKALWAELMYKFDAYLRLTLPTLVVLTGVTTGMAGYWISCLVKRRRVGSAAVSIPPVAAWRLPRDAIVYPPLATLLCYVLYVSGLTFVSGLDAAFNVLFNVSYLLFTMQGLGALMRLMARAKMKRGLSVVYGVLMALIAQPVLGCMGVYSALLGSKGIFTVWAANRKNRGGDGT